MAGSFPFPNNAYIVDLVTGETVYCQFMPPDIQDGKAALYQDYPIPGRSSPLKAFQYSSSRIISMTLQFWVAPHQGDDTPSPADINKTVRRLRAMLDPDYRQGIDPPHKLLIRVGFAIAMECVAVAYQRVPSATWFGGQLPGGQSSGAGGEGYPQLPHGEAIKMTFAEVRSVPLSYDEVADGADYYPGEGDTSSAAAGKVVGTGGGFAT